MNVMVAFKCRIRPETPLDILHAAQVGASWSMITPLHFQICCGDPRQLQELMPPLTATPKALEPVVLAPTVSIDEPHDAWLEKIFGLQRPCKNNERLEANAASASVSSDSDEQEHSYREELQQYITEATANLNKEPLEEDSSDDESESSDSDVFDFDSDDEDDYVEPPVEVPRSYRTQDLQGGMIVGGDIVLFTNWAFKRLLQRRRRLPPVPERRNSGDSEQFSSDEEDDAKGVYSGKIVEL